MALFWTGPASDRYTLYFQKINMIKTCIGLCDYLLIILTVQNHYVRQVLMHHHPELEAQLDFLALRTKNQPFLVKVCLCVCMCACMRARNHANKVIERDSP